MFAQNFMGHRQLVVFHTICSEQHPPREALIDAVSGVAKGNLGLQPDEKLNVSKQVVSDSRIESHDEPQIIGSDG